MRRNSTRAKKKKKKMRKKIARRVRVSLWKNVFFFIYFFLLLFLRQKLITYIGTTSPGQTRWRRRIFVQADAAQRFSYIIHHPRRRRRTNLKV